MEYCCKEFADNTGEANIGFEYDETNQCWSVNGCCGGGCYVLNDIAYCPFCGKKLEAPNTNMLVATQRNKT